MQRRSLIPRRSEPPGVSRLSAGTAGGAEESEEARQIDAGLLQVSGGSVCVSAQAYCSSHGQLGQGRARIIVATLACRYRLVGVKALWHCTVGGHWTARPGRRASNGLTVSLECAYEGKQGCGRLDHGA